MSWSANGQFPQSASCLRRSQRRHTQADTRVGEIRTQDQPSTKGITHWYTEMQSRLCYAWDPKLTACRSTSSAPRHRTQSAADDDQLPQTYPPAATTAQSSIAVRPVWCGSARICRAYGQRFHGAHESNTLRPNTHAGKCFSAWTARWSSVSNMRYRPITPRESVPSLSSRHRNKGPGDWKYFSKIDDNQATRTSARGNQLPTDFRSALNWFHQANHWMTGQLRAVKFETLSPLNVTHRCLAHHSLGREP